jgi:hypothetical protein
MKHVLALACLLCFSPLFAQLKDDFSDGTFKVDPVWQGDTSEFIVNTANELQLFAPDAGMSILSTTVHFPYAVEWQLRLRLEFAPSQSNAARIWLATNDLGNGDISGYFLDIGQDGSTDAVRLVRRQNGVSTVIATGVAGAVATEPVDVRLVVRYVGGNWTCLLAQGTTGALEQQFSVSDVSLPVSGTHLFGFSCTYSATRKDKFYFDDILIKADSSDVTAPVLSNVQVLDNQTINLIFDEPLDSLSAVTLGNYALNNATITAANWAASQPNAVVLQLAAPLANGQQYTLTATGVTDWLGNGNSVPQSRTFQFLVEEPAEVGDLIVNEIMANPSPSQGLPETAEWVEVLNRSQKYIRLSNIFISDATFSPRALPDVVLAPDSVLVVCGTSAASTLAAAGITASGITSFPSLNDDGDAVRLTNAQGLVIDLVNYLEGWHTEDGKEDGGWSLERINPDLLCLGEANWRSCPQLPGGSPGKRNFSFSTAPDTTVPRANKVTLVNSLTAQVTFSETLDMLAISNPDNYLISPDVDIAQVDANIDRTVATLVFATALPFKTILELRFAPGLTDCSGNAVAADQVLEFGVPEQPEPGDVLINEILFNPATGGSRFVEVYNNSDKILTMNELHLVNFEKSASGVAIAAERLMLPQTYWAYTINRDDILTRYPATDPAQLMPQILPSLDDRSGNISVYWAKGGARVLLDSFNYDAEYHNALLASSDREGVSLERIRFDAPTNNPNNWTSAAQRGTPTLPNSQRASGLPIGDDFLSLSSARISPDGDGYEDYLDIVWELDDSGYAATVTIYDSEGIPVRRIARQELAGTGGAIRWDGNSDDGSRVRPGIYVLFAEAFKADGTVKRAKLPFGVVFSRN